MPSSSALSYHGYAIDTVSHIFGVRIEYVLSDVSLREWQLWMPVWTPGSYLIREFSRHVSAVKAMCGDQEVCVTKTQKNRWILSLPEEAELKQGAVLTVSYEIYAFDSSVRAAYFDAERLALDGAAVWLSIEGTEALARHIIWQSFDPSWRWETALNEVNHGVYEARDYFHLVDSPMLAGQYLQCASIDVAGVPHDFVFDDAQPLDLVRLQQDMQRLCEWNLAFWGELPFKRYKVLTQVQVAGYGGLEHADSTRLLAARHELPRPQRVLKSEDYSSFLGLFSHEYFHSWWVKRLRPISLASYELEKENYTDLLWMFEGFTAYFDDLSLVQTRTIDEAQYLKILSRLLDRVRNTPAHARHSLSESSFEAWIRYYRPDENTPNSTVSYYDQGAVFAMVLDILLIGEGSSLARVLATLWKAHGIADAAVGISELDFIHALNLHAPTLDWVALLAQYIHAPHLPEYEKALKQVGVRVDWQYASTSQAMAQALGVQFKANALEVTKVLRGMPAAQAGVQVGDVWLALEGEALTLSDWHERWASFDHTLAQPLEVHFFRDKRLSSLSMVRPAPYASHLLRFEGSPSLVERHAAHNWLNRSASS